ncbi:hypothetical protein E3N88_44289 [Mikania micrantha]|uniref:RNase H type-1 domain-containing protein n=1 Tax=Mikania micrantha TaxID=192012 RepID=A0A5N6LCF0_9ASTR|nr:hypothetical protein E3N88_44289 [Mikania micrantha]
MSGSSSQPFSFTFVPPPHQATVATMVHTSTPAKSSAIRVDGEEAGISSSDHVTPRIPLTIASSVLPANLSSPGGGMIRTPSTLSGMSSSIPPPFYPYTPLMPPFNHSLPQTPIYMGTTTMPMHSNAMYISNSPISPSQSVLSTPTGSMSHEAILANLRTQLQFTGISAPQTASHNDMQTLFHSHANPQICFSPLDYSRPYKPPELLMKSKFIAPIALAEFQRKLKMPTNVGKYDGLSDPEDHYNVFVSAGGVEQWTMPAWCHMFVQTLLGAARIWFDSLPAGIRYNLESLQINGTTEALKVAGFIHGVRDKHLIRKLHGVNGTPEDMNTLMTIAKAYVQQEKSVTASAEWENKKNEKKMANVPVQSSYAGRKSSVEANMKSPSFRRETGRFAPYIPREYRKKRSMGSERREAVVKEVRKLVEAGILRETKDQTWVANPMMVQKSYGTWRMCIDYKDLNKACPKDNYPLPEIDLKVDSLSEFPVKCFLDAYKGYYQVQMAEEEENKTAFHTDIGIICYKKMPFGLKNAGAIYQRMMDMVFKDQIGKNVEVYVDDLLRKYNIKLNPAKCSFGVMEGKFLGVIVTKGGFKANPEKVEAIRSMASPRSVKEVQTLNGRLVAINRFLSKHAEKSLPFIVTLKKETGKEFQWTAEADQAFQALKKCLEELPALTAPHQGEVLQLYLSASEKAVLKRPEVSGRLAKWAIEVGVFDLIYKPRTAIKAQVIADFIAEIPQECEQEMEEGIGKEEQGVWEVYTDGASNVEGVGVGVMVVSPLGNEKARALKLKFNASNNEAEYEALIAGLQSVFLENARKVVAHVDSLLVSNQINGVYEIKEERMKQYVQVVEGLMAKFESCVVIHVPRSQNKKADALSKLASSFADPVKEISVEEVLVPTTEKNLLGPLLKCVDLEEANYLVREVHAGICEIHAGPRAVVAKLTNAGYYWPGMHLSAVEEIKKCQACQKHAPFLTRPKNELIPVTSVWPFQKWAIDLVGPFPQG